MLCQVLHEVRSFLLKHKLNKLFNRWSFVSFFFICLISQFFKTTNHVAKITTVYYNAGTLLHHSAVVVHTRSSIIDCVLTWRKGCFCLLWNKYNYIFADTQGFPLRHLLAGRKMVNISDWCCKLGRHNQPDMESPFGPMSHLYFATVFVLSRNLIEVIAGNEL